MGARGPLTGIGGYVFRVYSAAYVAIIGFALLGDINGSQARVVAVSERASAIAACGIGTALLLFAISGYRAVALRPTPAETQLVVMSPTPRSISLARPTAFSATSVAIAGALGTIALMLVAPTQFGGLSVAREAGYVAFGASLGVVGLGAHLLIAERRARFVIAAAAALAGASGYDAWRNNDTTPLTRAIETLRTGAAFGAVAATFIIGVALLVTANRGAERLPMELIARGGDVADRAVFAVAGNDLRSLLLLQRSVGERAWRRRPLFHVSRPLAVRYPLVSRTLRGVARWRLGRWAVIAASTLAASALLTVPSASLRTTALAAGVLWIAGLATAEAFAQENDRADLLTLYPSPRSIEIRHVLLSFVVVAVPLITTFVAAPWIHLTIASRLGLAVASASAASCASVVTYRRQWKQLVTPEMMLMDVYGTGGIAVFVKVLWPAVVANVALLGVRAHFNAIGVATTAAAVFVMTLLWVTRSAHR